MALYRYLYLSFWKDSKVLEQFTPDEKLLFIFFLTNSNTTQIGVYKILIKEVSFLTGFTEESIVIMMDRFEKDYKIIKYNKITHEIAIVHWAKYNINRIGGKPVIDCIRSELTRVDDYTLLEVITPYIKKEEIRKLYIEAIREGRCRDNKLGKSSDEYKKGEFLYEKPSEEQLRKARQLYN